MKQWITASWLMLLAAIIFGFFWYNELVYMLPTPVPSGYKTVQVGKEISLKNKLNVKPGEPVFLHFFNPDCPCSRFNIDHFKSLVKEYQSKVNFAIVLVTSKTYTSQQIADRFGINIPIITDTTLASTCGVYSTPQAVILKPNGQLFYRGNYNKSRYCTDEKTSYAKIALNGILNKTNRMQLDIFASKAYGCRLPNCTN